MPIGKREAKRLAAKQAADWIRAMLDMGSPLFRNGVELDPESADYVQVRDALDVVISDLEPK